MSYTNNGTAGVNLKYIKNNHNNLKSKTGGYYVANFATGDYVDIPEITLTGDFSYHAFLEVSTSALAYGLLGNSANDEQGIFINTSNQVSVRIGSTTYAATSSTMSNGFHLVQIVRNGSNILVYVDGVYIETLTVSTNDVVLNGVGVYNSLYFSTTIKDLSLFNTALTASQVANLYNNPQRFVELSREYGAERIYPFMEGNGEVGDLMYDYSGNDQHGTIQSNLAPAGTNFIYNDAEVGMQHTLTGRYVNGSNQFILPVTLTGYLDIAGNAITNKWKQGLLNFTGLDLVDNAHGGVEFGDQVDVADVTERTIERSLEYVDNGSDIVLETNGVAGVSGYELKISSTGKVVYTNGANTPLESTTTLTDGTKYDIILHHSGTTAEIFITELGNPHSTADASGTVGAIDAGTVIPNLSGNSLTTPSIHFDGDTTTSEKTNLSRYNNSKY